MAFARFIAQIIRLRAHFPDYAIKKVRLDNAGEFTSAAFNDFCMSVGIDVEHPVPHVHTQNGMAESLIKRLQLIARPLILRTKLPITVWGHAILHAGALVQGEGRENHQMISPGVHTLWLILILLLINARWKFRKLYICKDWLTSCPMSSDTKRVTKSYIPAANAPSKIEVPHEHFDVNRASEPVQLKRGRPIGSKDKNPRKKKNCGVKVPDEPKCLEDISEQVLVEPDKEVQDDDHEKD
ncbi:unnamed protein product [Microthlaspi erraticum]|uniref:Integrase catalytic domain-containing protein n=1 Tax=Microthlaspi erraticum TaxID=1685480 RepID=A0A6D2HEF5_9BRAS|nr:unnamed protein product [Microthlaspi erraticum]